VNQITNLPNTIKGKIDDGAKAVLHEVKKVGVEVKKFGKKIELEAANAKKEFGKVVSD
jgi:hypothetical protein